MKAFEIKYKVRKNEYKDIVVSDRERSAKFKLAMKHGCKVEMIKILESKIVNCGVKP